MENLQSSRFPIQWKHVLILTVCLMSIHLYLFRGLGIASDSGALPVVQPPKDEPLETPAADLSRKPHVVPTKSYQVANQDSPQNVHTEQFGTEITNEGDGNFPIDRIPSYEPIAICLAAHDQSKDLVEFFNHHYHHMGIRRFYIMDDNSEPPLSDSEYPGIPRTALTFIYQGPKNRPADMQMAAYSKCAQNYKGKHTWMGFFSPDEYLETPGDETLKEVLESFEDIEVSD
jgi:hypothetical protein